MDKNSKSDPRHARREAIEWVREARAALTDPAAEVPPDGWLQEGGLLYRLTDDRSPVNRDEINVTMADGSRSNEDRARRAGELLDRIRGGYQAAAEPEAMGDEPELPHTIYGLFYEEPGSISEQDEGYQEFLDEAGYTADQLRTYAKQYAQWHTTAQAGGLPEGWQFRVLSPGSITVQTESGYSCTLWKSGHGGVEALAYQMADMLRKSLTAAPQAPALDADPLQGAANWIVSATSYDRATHIAEIQQRLLIGYNRASRLYDAAMSAQGGAA